MLLVPVVDVASVDLGAAAIGGGGGGGGAGFVAAVAVLGTWPS